jgi:predicted metalloprotease with PDZ domain
MDYRNTAWIKRAAGVRRSQAKPLRYRISLAEPDAHLLAVSLRIEDPDPSGELLALPAWIPGSYLIRDFVRHVVQLSATADGKAVAADKVDLHTWRIVPGAGSKLLQIDYRVYAWDLSVRGAHFDRNHAFLNGTALLLRPLGRDDAPCELVLEPPRTAPPSDWRVATTLPPASGTARDGFGRRVASDYFALIDHPIECGRFETLEFKAGKPARKHRIAISGLQGGDRERLRADLARLCAWHLDFWGGAPPFREYLFLLQLTADGYGGLEHGNSTALIARRDELPAAGAGEPDEGYQRLLGLFSHEYFHAWLVKRIQPAGHQRPDLQQPAPTEMLWLFEGFTAYYDDLALVRSGLITPARYLALLAKTIAKVLTTPGRLRQSVAEAARDAWIKLYRPDENSDNATVSYYAKGSLVALALDLKLRRDSGGQTSLDDLMRMLWQRHGTTGAALDEAGFRACLGEIGGEPLVRFARRAVHGTADLPLQTLLAEFAVDWQEEPVRDASTLGIALAGKEALPKVSRVASGSAAESAGLAGGDQLLAFAGLRADKATIDDQLRHLKPGTSVTLHAFRDGLLREFTLLIPRPYSRLKELVVAPRGSTAARRLRKAWLGS